MKGHLFGRLLLQALIVYGRWLADAPKPVIKAIVFLRVGEIIQGKIKPPEYDPLVGFLFDEFV
jgi:hypothetical protein